ncbi:MAG: hypothetical protein IJM91_01850 [Lachnospiraceae bacterium]|nr:hypothetical protein [Lachnospiraceae bacterium]
MDYNLFLHEVTNELSLRYINTAKVKLSSVTKNNGVTHDCAIITENDKNISESIYLSQFYDLMQRDNLSVSEICDRIIELHTSLKAPDYIDASFFLEYKNVKPQIAFKLVNLMMNKELLKEVPHIIYLDLAIVFLCLVDDPAFGRGSILIRNSHLEKWGKTVNDLYEDALNNSKSLMPYKLMGMDEFLNRYKIRRELPYEESIPPLSGEVSNMYILTNDSQYFGASSLLYDNLLRNLAEQFKSSFFILPSSVHEVILFPTNNKDNLDAFNTMVREVNTYELRREDILSDHAYFYDYDDKALYAS